MAAQNASRFFKTCLLAFWTRPTVHGRGILLLLLYEGHVTSDFTVQETISERWLQIKCICFLSNGSVLMLHASKFLLKNIYQTRCSRSCSTNSLVIS